MAANLFERKGFMNRIVWQVKVEERMIEQGKNKKGEIENRVNKKCRALLAEDLIESKPFLMVKAIFFYFFFDPKSKAKQVWDSGAFELTG